MLQREYPMKIKFELEEEDLFSLEKSVKSIHAFPNLRTWPGCPARARSWPGYPARARSLNQKRSATCLNHMSMCLRRCLKRSSYRCLAPLAILYSLKASCRVGDEITVCGVRVQADNPAYTWAGLKRKSNLEASLRCPKSVTDCCMSTDRRSQR